MSTRLCAGLLAPLVLLALAVRTAAGGTATQERKEAPYTGDRDWERRGRLPDWGEHAPGVQVVPQKNLPIDRAPLVALDALKYTPADTDLVIGLEYRGLARAYPLKALGSPQREIINDRLGQEPFVVNW